jgi:Flp pilus assembly protein TadG
MKNFGPQTGKALRTLLQRIAVKRSSVPIRIFHTLAGTEGSQLLEFGLSLPFLLVFLIGIIQFGGAFNLKQKMANGAREGARIVVSNTLADSSCGGSNCSVQTAVNAMANYMTNEGVNSSCINPSSPSSSGTLTWTYSCKGISMTVNHAYVYTPAGGTPITGTQVTLAYPYTWFFNDIIKLLVPKSNIGLPNTLTETAVMKNIAN